MQSSTLKSFTWLLVLMTLLSCKRTEDARTQVSPDWVIERIAAQDTQAVQDWINAKKQFDYDIQGPLYTLVFYSMSSEHIDFINILCTSAVDLSHDYGKGGTAITLAAQVGELEILKTLHAAGAALNRPSHTHRSPLMASIIYKNKDGQSYLLKNGATLNLADVQAARVIGMDIANYKVAGEASHE